MIRTRYALVALCLLPGIGSAQRGGGGGRDRGTRADYNAMEKDAPAPMKLTRGDLEDISPLKLLMDKRKELKLTDDQQKQLKELQGKLKDANAPLLSRFDSLRIVARPRPNPSDEDQLRMAIGREEILTVVKSLRASYDASAQGAMAVLDDAQKATATGLLEKQANDAQGMLNDKLNGGRSMSGGGRPGRPPAGS